MSDANERLLVKELANALGVSRQFVYQMRACGFRMRGRSRNSQRATLDDASRWIEANQFRLANGRGVVGTPRPPAPPVSPSPRRRRHKQHPARRREKAPTADLRPPTSDL